LSISSNSQTAVLIREESLGASPDRVRKFSRVAVCLGLLALLMIWAVIWPQTGDGDAITHFLNARDALRDPRMLMGSWARVGAMLPLVIPAQFGLLAARWTSAVISVLCAWQTMRLADDLDLPHAILAAPFVILQPLAFALAGDTMTELPMALVLVIGIRLWLARRWLLSALVISYLPLVRPEGFFLCAMWGVFVLTTAEIGSIGRRISVSFLLGTGVAAWMLACWIIVGKPMYFLHDGWAWPADSRQLYGSGPFFTYLDQLPSYCGWILFSLLVLGLAPLLRNKMLCILGIGILAAQFVVPWVVRERVLPYGMIAVLAWAAWERRKEKFVLAWFAGILVLTLHSVLWWRGWFASDGLLRILACVSPVIAIICLRGWNTAENFLAKVMDIPWVRAIESLVILAIALTTFNTYAGDPIHYRIFGVRALANYARENKLLDAPMLTFRDPIAIAELNLPPSPANVQMVIPSKSREAWRLFDAPVGTIAFWDTQHDGESTNVDLDDLPQMGYRMIYQYELTTLKPVARLRGRRDLLAKQLFVVVRKETIGQLPAYVLVK
jgi:hypothetical protein